MLFFPIGILALLWAFYALSITADEFLSPSLQQISKTFKLSESLAGVTLLAFGGGAPDVFASLSAAGGGDLEGIEMGIAVCCGSSLFLISIVNAVIIYFSTESIAVNPVFFTRDAFFLLIALITLLYAVAIRGCIDLIMSVIFIALYVAYVIAVFLQYRAYSKDANSDVACKAALAANMTELGAISNLGAKPKDLKKKRTDSDVSDSLMSYDFESQFKQESSAFYYIGDEKPRD